MKPLDGFAKLRAEQLRSQRTRMTASITGLVCCEIGLAAASLAVFATSIVSMTHGMLPQAIICAFLGTAGALAMVTMSAHL